MKIDLKLLGHFRVTVDGVPMPPERWKLNHPRQLLQMLAIQHDHQLRRDQVLEHLWPRLDQEAANNRLYHTIHLLRKMFDNGEVRCKKPLLLLHTDVMMLNPEHAVSVDASRFLALVAQVRRCPEPLRPITLLEEAIELYDGDLLPNHLNEDWLFQRREACKLAYVWALEGLAASKRIESQVDLAITLYQQLVDVEPANEQAHRALMELHQANGHPERAIQQYASCRRFLNRDLDAEPTPETTLLLESIRSGGAHSRSSNRSPLNDRRTQWARVSSA